MLVVLSSGVVNCKNPNAPDPDAEILKKIFITDQLNGRIVRVDDTSGTGWVAFGSIGSGTNNFNNPYGIFIDSEDHIYVTDYGNHRIVRIDDMLGNGWVAYGTNGSGIGNFDRTGSVSFH